MSTPVLLVVAPDGQRSRLELHTLPFEIGRQADNHLVLRDSRMSRSHARIIRDEAAGYQVEDAGSRHGVFVNGRRVERESLQPGDRVEFGVSDSYQIVFAPEEITRNLPEAATEGIGANLGRLKAVLEIARTLQTSYSLQDILNSVVDAALAVTGAERGFLLLHNGKELEHRCARDRACRALGADALRIPRQVIQQALQSRRELLSMSFQPPGTDGDASESVVNLELRSVVCIPLIRIHNPRDASRETAGLIYLDSRFSAREMAAGDRELLQTLAVEASVIIENARLLEEEREKKKLDDELRVARGIQQSLLPRSLPCEGWFQAAGSSEASSEVGGDYFDVIQVDERSWAVLVADVSGKGMSSALVASLLQGAFLNLAGEGEAIETRMARINRFLCERLEAGMYATLFFGVVDEDGLLRYVNAGHCAPLLISDGERGEYLESTGMPLGMFADAVFEVEEARLKPGDKLVIYSDGATDAQNDAGDFLSRPRLRKTIEANAGATCGELHTAIHDDLKAFTAGAPQADDITLLVLQYRPV